MSNHELRRLTRESESLLDRFGEEEMIERITLSDLDYED